ncbi:hypothetical protein ACRRVD_03555 [Candidatus Cardinium hertigii]|uniref:hypothetical protein n=1 Tax=Candidatus Cardinium hertigii TaxID=247481 RepID=UPI003D7EBCA6
MYHFLSVAFKQKKQKYLISIIHYICFTLLGFLSHANEIQKITTPYFNIGFYKSVTCSAQRIANTLETIYNPVCKTLGVYPNPISLWIDNQSTECNGFFTNMPRHIKMYTLYAHDPYFIGNEDWLNMLCIHEFRHAVQHSIEYYSTPSWLKPLYFFGNLVNYSSVPPFFKEGDAVGIETALTKSGRGRLPGWEKLYKVNLLERGAASFGRQIFGSLKHELTSEYHIGYYFTTHIRRNYGLNAIKSIFEKTIQGIPFFGFYHAIKKVTKKSILQVYNDMNQELLVGWQKQLEGLKITPATQLTFKKEGDSFDYMQPFIDASGNLIACKRGIGLRDQLVQVTITPSEPTVPKNIVSPFQKDKTIFYFINRSDTFVPSTFAIGQGCAVWLEPCTHPWKGKQRTIRLQHYDFKQRKRRTLVARSRYNALAIRPDTRQLVAVASDESSNHFLVVLETKSGKVVKKIDNPDNGYYLTPSWSGASDIVVVKTKDQKNSIVRINTDTGKTEILLPYTYEHRSYPKLYKDYLLYNSSYNGIDNIYAMHLPTQACFQVTSRKYGAYLGMVDPITNQLIFSDYTKNGMEIAAMPFDPLLWTPLKEVEDRSVAYYEPLVVQEENGDILEKVPNHRYPVTKCRFGIDNIGYKGINLALNRENKSLDIVPFTLVNLQDNLKVTPYFSLFMKPKNQFPTTEIRLQVKYRSFYPIFNVDITGIAGTRDNTNKNLLYFYDIKRKTALYWKTRLGLGIRLPHYFTLGKCLGKASLGAVLNLNQPFDKKGSYNTDYFFKIKNHSMQSKRDRYPPWMQLFNVAFSTHRAFYKNNVSYKDTCYFNFACYLPGIQHHHYFIFTLNPIIEVERFKNLNNKWSYMFKNIKLKYGLPLAYPECGIPFIWFLKDIWINGHYSTLATNQNPDTFGLEFNFSSKLLSNKNIYPIDISIDFRWFKKINDEWICKFEMPHWRIRFNPKSC